jgi:diadenosine tetraphosphate (Ap4A) HIT family hydrolase
VSCVFCKIVAGTAPASIAYADGTAVAFLDISPMTPGHLLVVPRTHAEGLADLDAETDGAAAGQEVWHVHLHVIPRWRGDGVKLGYKAGRPARADLDAHAADLQAAMRAISAGP